MKNAKIWIDFFLIMSEQLKVTEIKNCGDVDKWAEELQESFKKQDAIDDKLKRESHDLKWFLK